MDALIEQTDGVNATGTGTDLRNPSLVSSLYSNDANKRSSRKKDLKTAASRLGLGLGLDSSSKSNPNPSYNPNPSVTSPNANGWTELKAKIATLGKRILSQGI